MGIGEPGSDAALRPGSASQRGERGMVTAELAVATLSALALLVVFCWGIYLVVLQMRCIDTAGEVARQSARGDDAAVDRASQDAPGGAHVRIISRKDVTVVEVTLIARPLAHWLVAVPLRADAEVVPEPEARR